MVNRNLYPAYFMFLIAFICSSCNKNALFIQSEAIPDNTWVVNQPLRFEVPVEDTINPYNIYITIRNENEYMFNNLYLFIDITSPRHITERDTMECILADDNGWLGRGLGDIWDNKLLFKQVHFPNKGNYQFMLTQAMRVDSLPMIMDVGITIERGKE